MIGKVYIIFITFIVIFTFVTIIKILFERRQRKNKEIIKLNKNLRSLILGSIWFIFLITWSVLFINSAHKAYLLFHGEYIDNVFQLFDIEYLESLRIYFYENSMLIQLLNTIHYKENLLIMPGWIIGSLCVSISYFYIGWEENAIYENGILINSKILNWNKIIDYRWSNAYEKKIFKKGKYYDLILTLPKSKFFNLHLDNEIRLRINYDDKGSVDHILRNQGDRPIDLY